MTKSISFNIREEYLVDYVCYQTYNYAYLQKKKLYLFFNILMLFSMKIVRKNTIRGKKGDEIWNGI